MKLHQQYHFRESERGLLAWDVLRLIELTQKNQVVQVPLSEIRELKETYWFGLGAPLAKAGVPPAMPGRHPKFDL